MFKNILSHLKRVQMKRLFKFTVIFTNKESIEYYQKIAAQRLVHFVF